MGKGKFLIDGLNVEIHEGLTILKAAQNVGIYIPALCSHPDLPHFDSISPSPLIYQGSLRHAGVTEDSYQGCQVCLVEVDGEGIRTSCNTLVRDGMSVRTNTSEVKERRKKNLSAILSEHPHTCLVCPQREGCDLKQCSNNVPENERCCYKFNMCELRKVSQYVGLRDDLPRFARRGLPVVENEPLFKRDYNLCIGCTRCVRVCSEVRGVRALSFTKIDGKPVVGTLAPTLKESGCKFCTACIEVCPTGALVDKTVRPGKKEEDIVRCKHACPANIDIPGYLLLIAEGKIDEANAVIREKVPFPGVLGRVCNHPCEEACRRGEVNAPVSICALKRYVSDNEKGLWKKGPLVKKETGKKVAVVGVGPAGLTVAFYLRKQGHTVTLLESKSKPGGMMRYGIPSYRLPKSILDKEVKDILELGIEFRSNQTLGKEFTVESLKNERFDAIFLGIGAQLSSHLNIEGLSSDDVFWGIDFLASVAEGKDFQLKDRVIVIGGGNVAVDVARSLLRCGVKEVIMVCLETREKMPAHELEVEEALEEGVRLMPSWGPYRVINEKGRVTGVELVQCLSVFDEEGNFCPRFDDDSKKTIKGDQVIIAIGQVSDLSFIREDSSIWVDKGRIVVDQNTFVTNMKGVYAGGDVVRVPGTIIDVIAMARKAASSIDRALGGSGEIDEVLFNREQPSQYLGRDEGFAEWPREEIPRLDLNKRYQGFHEISHGYKSEQAFKEAKRCLRCDLRLKISSAILPPEKWLELNVSNTESVPETEGVFQLFDNEKNIIYIKGTMNLREELLGQMRKFPKAKFFIWEEEPMFTKRESELLQQFMQQYAKLPEGNVEIDEDFFN